MQILLVFLASGSLWLWICLLFFLLSLPGFLPLFLAGCCFSGFTKPLTSFQRSGLSFSYFASRKLNSRILSGWESKGKVGPWMGFFLALVSLGVFFTSQVKPLVVSEGLFPKSLLCLHLPVSSHVLLDSLVGCSYLALWFLQPSLGFFFAIFKFICFIFNSPRYMRNALAVQRVYRLLGGVSQSH